MKVVDLEDKIEVIMMHLKLRSQKQLTKLLNCDAAVIAQWKKNDSQVPHDRLNDLADLLGVHPLDVATFTSAALAKVLRDTDPARTLWNRALNRTSHGQIALRRVAAQSARREEALQLAIARSNRDLVPASKIAQVPAEAEEEFKIGEQVFLTVTVPWSSFQSANRLHLLLFLTVDSRTHMLTARPLTLKKSQESVDIPEAAAAEPLVFQPPSGEHRFAAVYLDTALEAIDEELAGGFTAQGPIDPAHLNSLGRLLLLSEDFTWHICKKRILVSRQ